MKLGIVIINYRTPAYTIDCLRSLAPEVARVVSARVVVVDNASGDGSAEVIAQAICREGWGEWARLVRSPRNLGFAGGNNFGARELSEARYLLLLNSDTIVHAGCLAHCLDVMEADRTIGAMGCLLINRDGTPQNSARRLPHPLRETPNALRLTWKCPRLFGWADLEDMSWDRRSEKRDVGWLGGAFIFCRGELYRELGGLDEAFFFYGEDIEFCYRVWRTGWRVCYDPSVSVTHLGGGSSDPGRLDPHRRGVYAWQGRYLVQRKCYGRSAARWLRVADVMGLTARGLWLACRGERKSDKCQSIFTSIRQLTRPLGR